MRKLRHNTPASYPPEGAQALGQQAAALPEPPQAMPQAEPESAPQTEPETLPAAPDAPNPAQQALMQRLLRQSAQMQQYDPAFDLGRALQNPRFARLVAAGLDVPEACRTMRQPALVCQAYQFGLAQGKSQAQAAHNRSRPIENGTSPAGVVTALDPAGLSRQQRQEIRRMVRSGKTVTF